MRAEYALQVLWRRLPSLSRLTDMQEGFVKMGGLWVALGSCQTELDCKLRWDAVEVGQPLSRCFS